MCTKSNDPMEIEEIEGYEQLKSYVLKVARTHGEEAVRRLFEKRGCARLSSLPIGAVSVFRADLDRLAATPSPADIALNRAIAAASAPHGSYYASLDRDRALFEAGREYQRKY